MPLFISKKHFKILIIFFLLLAIPLTVLLALSRQEIRKKAAELSSPPSQPKPEYVSGEVLVKLKTPIENPDLDIKPLIAENLHPDSLPPVINSINERYKIKSIEKVFKGAENPQKEIDKFKNKFSSEIASGRRKINEEELSKIDLSRTYKLSFDPKASVEDVIREISKNPEIEYAEPNFIYKKDSAPNDPYYLDSYPNNISNRDPSWNPPHDYQWNIKKTNSENNWQTDTSNIIVAVIDTGVDVTHPELGNVWFNPNEIPNNSIDDDNNGCVDDINGCNTSSHPPDGNIIDDDNHGTHIAGVVSAKTNNQIGIVGVTNNTKIMAIKVFWANGYANAEWISNGIRYAVNNGARVVNMSLGGSFSQTMKEALDYAIGTNTIPVVAAGNGNQYSPSHFPASYPRAITVSAVDEELNKLNYSNYGPNIDVAAPGGGKTCGFWDKPGYCSNILSLKSSQNNNDTEYVVGGQYLRMSGTSMATPHAAGVVAMLLAQHPSFGIGDIENYIRLNSIDRLTEGHNEQTGWGMVNSTGTDFIPDSNIDFNIKFPFENALVGDKFNIEGVIRADNFDRFTVQYRLKGTTEWFTNGVNLVGSGLTPITPTPPKSAAKVAEISLPDNSLNGDYEIKTTIFMTNGKILTATKTVSYFKKQGTFWYYQGSSNENTPTGDILISDINNDNFKEIILFNFGIYDQKKLAVYDKNNMLLWQKENLGGEVVVGDIDQRSPGKEIIIQTDNQIKVYSAEGSEISDMTLNFSSDQVFSIANITIVSDENDKYALCFIEKKYQNRRLHCFEQNNDNQFIEKFSVDTDLPTKKSWPVSGDVNGDQKKELIVSKDGKLTILSLVGNIVSQYNSLGFPLVLADIDKDGKEEIITYNNNAIRVLKLDNSNTIYEAWNYSIPNANPFIAIADFNNDIYPDIYFHNNRSLLSEIILKNDGSLLYSGYPAFYSSFDTPNIVMGDRNGNGKTEVYFSGQLSVDSRSYLSIREFDWETHQFNNLDGVWKSIIPGCAISTTWYSCQFFSNIGLALTDLNNNMKLDLVLAGIGVIEYNNQGASHWPHRYHDYQRSNSYNFSETPPNPSQTPTPTVAPPLTPTPIPTLSPTPTSAPTATPTPTPTKIPTPTPQIKTLTFNINIGSDDAYQEGDINKKVVINDSKLKLGWYVATTGFRFKDDRLINLKGKTITNAHLALTALDNTSSLIKLRIRGEKSGTCQTFSATQNNLGSRTKTIKYVDWQPNSWNINARYNSPNLSLVVSEIVQMSDFQGKNLCFYLENFGSANYTQRLVSAKEDIARQSATITITYY